MWKLHEVPFAHGSSCLLCVLLLAPVCVCWLTAVLAVGGFMGGLSPHLHALRK